MNHTYGHLTSSELRIPMDSVIPMEGSSEFADCGLGHEHRQAQVRTTSDKDGRYIWRSQIGPPERYPATTVSDEFVRIADLHSTSSSVRMQHFRNLLQQSRHLLKEEKSSDAVYIGFANHKSKFQGNVGICEGTAQSYQLPHS